MLGERQYDVCILCRRARGTFYIGVTNNLTGRTIQHREKVVPGFTKKYDVDRLVYFVLFDNLEFAIRREKRLKQWNRAWKIALIEEHNPDWHDLYIGLTAA